MEISEIKILDGDTFKSLTPETIAELFSCMHSDEQARFFNHVAKVASEYNFAMQLQYITDEDGLDLSGRRVMQSIGEYSHWGLVQTGNREFIND
jgi:hypothetical protein